MEAKRKSRVQEQEAGLISGEGVRGRFTGKRRKEDGSTKERIERNVKRIESKGNN